MTIKSRTDELTVIQPKNGWRGIDFRELREYGDLFLFLILRNVKVRYAQSVIGVGWAMLQPIASMAVFSIVFGRLVGLKGDGAPYALFTFAALVPWTYFSNCLTEGTASMISNSQMISKIYFPRLLIPLSILGARLIDFLISMCLLGVLLISYDVSPTSGAFAIPLLVLILIATAGGIALWLAALAVQYRDVNYSITFVVQLLMYATPVVYSASLVPEHLQSIYALNPMVGVIEGFRSAFLGTRSMPWNLIAIGAAVSTIILVSGVFYFRRREHVFADVS